MAREARDSASSPPAATALQRAAWFASLFFVMLGVCVRILGQGDVTSYGANLLVEMFIVVGGAFWAMQLVLSGRMARIRSPLSVVIALFFALSLVSAFRAPHLQNSIPTLIDWASYLLVFFLVIQLGITRKSAGLLIYALVACAAVVSVYGIFQYHHLLERIAWQLETDPAATLREMGQPITALSEVLGRVKDKRIYATFVNPNSFAGFLLMTIPLSVGVLLDSCRRRRDTALYEGAAAFLATSLQVHALVLTFSKGGYVTFLAMAVIFVIMAGARFIKSHTKLFVAIAAAAVLIAALLSAVAVERLGSADEQPTRVAAKLRGAAESMQVRIGYWGAGLKMIADHPLLGVGLNNFGDRYFEYKLPAGREVKKAHNNYVQVAAELGIPGLILFCLLWGGFVYASIPRGRIQHEAPREPAIFHTIAAAGAFAFVTEGLLLGSLETFPALLLSAAAHTVLLGFWLAMFIPGAASAAGGARSSGTPDDGPRDLSFTRIGVAVGLIGFLIHGAVDFDLYVPGCAQTAWMLAALALVLRERRLEERVVSIKPALRWAVAAAAVAFTVVMIAPGTGLVTRAYEAETLTTRAKRKRNEEPLTDKNLRAAVELCERATEANPLDDAARYELGQCYETIWLVHGKKDGRAFHSAIHHFRRTLELNPTHSAALNQIAMMYRDAATYEKRLLLQRIPGHEPGLNTTKLARRQLEHSPIAGQLDLRGNFVDASFVPYVWAAAEAVASYPTNPRFRVTLGEALHLAGLKDEAAAQYAEALEYDRVAPIDRLKLPDDTRQLAEERAGARK